MFKFPISPPPPANRPNRPNRRSRRSRQNRANRRKGTILGKAVHVELPEMAISFARGLVLQLRVRQDAPQDAPLVWLGGAEATIVLAAKANGDVDLRWRCANGEEIVKRAKMSLPRGVWCHLTVVLDARGVYFYLDGAPRAAYTSPSPGEYLPQETARRGNAIGIEPGKLSGAFDGTIAEVRLWNRTSGFAVIHDRRGRELRGDEPGLVGYWSLEGAEGILDASPFGRDGTLVGGDAKPGVSSFIVAQRVDRCLDLDGDGSVTIDLANARVGGGFTWQAHVLLRDLSRDVTLLSFGDLKITAKEGALLVDRLTTAVRLKIGVWMSLAVRIGVDGSVTTFVDGAMIGAPAPSRILPPSKNLPPSIGNVGSVIGKRLPKFGAGLDGQIAEVRIWSRALSSAEIADTSDRRIHGWAPGLIGAWRLDEELDPPAAEATIYADSNYSGASQRLGPGRHDLAALTFGNDKLSSLRVPPGLQVILFDDAGFKGAKTTFTADTPRVRNNDRTSSIVVKAAPRKLININPTGPALLSSGARPAAHTLELGDAPRVAPPRVAAPEAELVLPKTTAIGAGGFTVQMWVNLSTGPRAPLLSLVAPGAAKSSPPVVKIKVLPGTTALGLNINTSNTEAKGRCMAKDVVTPYRWTQVTITQDGAGMLCLYIGGRLLRRKQLPVLTPQSLRPQVGPFAGSITELRLWPRALTRDEIEANWQRRGSFGATARWALRGDLKGTPGPAIGAVTWTEAPSLALPDPEAPVRPTVRARSSLLADQTGKKRKVQLCVDLSARDDQGRPVPLTDIEVVTDGNTDTKFFRATARKSNKLDAGGSMTLTADARGTARLVLKLRGKGLVAPILKVRHAGMGEGEWAIITPDQVIFDALASLTADELTKGRRATATTKAGSEGLVASGSEELVLLLSSMLSATASFSFEAESTAALAFGDDGDGDDGESAPPLTVLDAGSSVVQVAERTALVRRLGRPPISDTSDESDDDDEPISFDIDIGGVLRKTVNVLEDGVELVEDGVAKVVKKGVAEVSDLVEESVDLAVDGAVAVVKESIELFNVALDTVEDVGKAVTTEVVESLTFVIDTVINGVEIAKQWVVSTVEEIASAVVELFEAIGKTVGDVLDYLAVLFDWGDIVATADLFLGEVTRSIGDAKSGVGDLFDTVKGSISAIESKVLVALGGEPSLPPAVGEATADNATAELPETPDILDYLLSLLPDDLSQTIEDFNAVFDPIEDLMLSAFGRLSTLGDGIAEEWEGGALKDALADPRRFFDGDPSELLELARILIKVIANASLLLVDFVGDLTVAFIESFERLINLRLNIPYLTDFVETYALGGRQLTVGLMLCLVPAIPATILYKAITGSKDGPAGSESPQSSAGDVGLASDLTVRSLDIVGATFSGIIDSYEAVSSKDNVPKLVKWVSWTLGTTNLVLGVADLLTDVITDDEQTGDDWLQTVLNILGAVFGTASTVSGGMDLKASGEGESSMTQTIDQVCSLLGDGCSAVSGIVNVITVAIDDTTSKIDVTISSLDLAASVSSCVADIASMLPKGQDPYYEGARKATIVTSNVASVGCKVAAFTFVCIGADD